MANSWIFCSATSDGVPCTVDVVLLLGLLGRFLLPACYTCCSIQSAKRSSLATSIVQAISGLNRRVSQRPCFKKKKKKKKALALTIRDARAIHPCSMIGLVSVPVCGQISFLSELGSSGFSYKNTTPIPPPPPYPPPPPPYHPPHPLSVHGSAYNRKLK